MLNLGHEPIHFVCAVCGVVRRNLRELWEHWMAYHDTTRYVRNG